MRIAPCGTFAFWDDEIVVKHSEIYAKVTHADPGCVFASVASGLLIARYIQWNAGMLGEAEPDIDEILELAKKKCQKLNIIMMKLTFIHTVKLLKNGIYQKRKKLVTVSRRLEVLFGHSDIANRLMKESRR